MGFLVCLQGHQMIGAVPCPRAGHGAAGFMIRLCGLLDLTLGNGSLTESVLGAAVNVLQETHTASSCGAATDGLHGPVVPVCVGCGEVEMICFVMCV